MFRILNSYNINTFSKKTFNPKIIARNIRIYLAFAKYLTFWIEIKIFQFEVEMEINFFNAKYEMWNIIVTTNMALM